MKKLSDCCKLALLILVVNLTSFIPLSFSSSSETALFPVFRNYPIPEKLSLCDEWVPLDDPHVKEMFDREFTIAVWNPAQVFMWLKRAGRYFPHIENELAKAGLPDDLKYLAIAESALIHNIRSRAGAMGIWQFMPSTGEEYGLTNTTDLDERRHFEKSTDAAIRLLATLRQEFGSWTLAMAAYNCGKRCIDNAIKNQKTANYYRLSLPQETERYVYRIAAIKTILENPDYYGYHISDNQIYHPIAADTIKIQLQYPLDIADIADELGTDFKMIKELNPHLIGNYLPQGKYPLKVPVGKGQKLFVAIDKLSKIAIEKLYEFYIVQPGDNLYKISAATGVSISRLKTLNAMRADTIHVGQKLRIK